MKMIITSCFVIFLFVRQAAVAEAVDSTWEIYQDMLKSAVTVKTFTSIDGEFSHTYVDYEKIKNNPLLQEKVIHQLEKLKTIKTPEGKRHKLAFWINAYNFFTIVEIVNYYPVAGIKEIGWRNRHHEVGGVFYSLDDIEHNVIRPLADPRIHFAINCASVGCPSLNAEIFTGDQIDTQLDNAVINALKNPLHLRLISENRISATQIFQWFSRDFESGGYKGVADFINRFAPERLWNIHEIENKIEYDWDLNTEQNTLEKMKEIDTEFPELRLKMK